MDTGTDVAVVGAGIVGLATAVALLDRDATVTVYERGAPGSAQSGGDSRIFRHLHDDAELVALVCESRALWRVWEERFATELLAADGLLAFGPAVHERLALLRDAGVRVRLAGADEARERLTLLGEDVPQPALLDEDAGVLRTRPAVRALAGVVGERLVADEVLSVRATRRGTVEVRTLGATVEHDRAVVCAGRDTARLAAGAGLALPVRLSAHVRLAFGVRGAPLERPACLLDASGAFGEPHAYGDPLPGDDRFAVGLFDVPARDDGAVLDPAQLGEAARRTSAYVARALPGAVPEPVEARHCWVTTLPWHHDALAAWALGPLTVFAGNNAFKHAPVLGRALAAAALGEGVRPVLAPGPTAHRDAAAGPPDPRGPGGRPPSSPGATADREAAAG